MELHWLQKDTLLTSDCSPGLGDVCALASAMATSDDHDWSAHVEAIINELDGCAEVRKILRAHLKLVVELDRDPKLPVKPSMKTQKIN